MSVFETYSTRRSRFFEIPEEDLPDADKATILLLLHLA